MLPAQRWMWSLDTTPFIILTFISSATCETIVLTRFCNSPKQHPVTVLRNPHQVVVVVIERMTPPRIPLHPSTLNAEASPIWKMGALHLLEDSKSRDLDVFKHRNTRVITGGKVPHWVDGAAKHKWRSQTFQVHERRLRPSRADSAVGRVVVSGDFRSDGSLSPPASTASAKRLFCCERPQPASNPQLCQESEQTQQNG